MNGTNFAGNASKQIGDLSKLKTQDKSSVVNAINEASESAAAAQQAASSTGGYVQELKSAIKALPDGQAVTAEVAAHTLKLTDLERNVEGQDRNYTPNYAINIDGVAFPIEGFGASDFIEVSGQQFKVTYSRNKGDGGIFVNFYNESKQSIGRFSIWDTKGYRILTPSEAGIKYVRIPFYLEDMDIVKLEVDGNLVWQPHDEIEGVAQKIAKLNNADTAINAKIKNLNASQFYNNGENTLYVEEGKNSGSDSVFFASSMWAGRVTLDLNYDSMQTLATAMGVELVTSPKGMANCIEIPQASSFVIDGTTRKPTIKARGNVADNDILLIACVAGRVRGFNTNLFGRYLFSRFAEIESKIPADGRVGEIDAKVKEFASHLAECGLAQSFVFMTDPHLGGNNNTINLPTFYTYIDVLSRIYKQTCASFLLCGGDWLNNNDSKEIAAAKLSFIDGYMRDKFGEGYFPMLGNHDTNYQGEEALSDVAMRNLMFGKYEHNYYTFKNGITRFFVLDTGIDWDSSMTEYRLGQFDWLGEQLKANTDEHIAIGMHIVSNGTESTWGASRTQMAYAVMQLIGAFNARESIYLYNKTYDFTNAVGKVHFVISGHSNFDYLDNGFSVPIVVTASMQKGGVPTFDLCTADYTNNKLYLTRVGYGNNRIVDIV